MVIPRQVVQDRDIRENEEVTLEIRKPTSAKAVFGLLKGWKKSAQEIKDDARKGWDSSSDRKRWK